MQQAYNDFGAWIRRGFPFRVQKISVDAGFSCPNRDGKISRGGCTFCDNHTFNPSYCNSRKSITEQLEEGKAFFARKYPDMKYLAYFQAYSNTYAPVPRLKQLYEEALSDEDVVGIVIGTRPDCLSPEILDYLEELNRRTFVIVELGVESANDETLLLVNRGHTFADSVKAIEAVHLRGILVGAHIILGLPGEDREEILRQASVISSFASGYPQTASVADYQRYMYGATILRGSFSSFQCRRIYRIDRRVLAITAQRYSSGALS